MRLHVGIPGKSLILALDVEEFAVLGLALDEVAVVGPDVLDAVNLILIEALHREIAGIRNARDFIPNPDAPEAQE
jgi:hypothetical protein